MQDFLAARADVISGQRVSYPAGHSRKAPVVFSVGVAKGDLASVPQTLETVYQGNLCVFQGKVTLAENTRVTEILSTLMGERKELNIYQGGGAGAMRAWFRCTCWCSTTRPRRLFAPLGLEKLEHRRGGAADPLTEFAESNQVSRGHQARR